MLALLIGLLLVPPVDQSLKLLVRNCLGAGTIRLGAAGKLRVVESRMWAARGQLSPATLWTIWLVSAAVLTALATGGASYGFFAGLLMGGSLSHLLESTRRGRIVDYVCLRFWPAFNAADVAITVGAIGTLVNTVRFVATI